MHEHKSRSIQIDPEGLYDGAGLRMLLGVSDSALCRARARDELRSVLRGRRRFYRGAWVLAWLSDGKPDAGATGGQDCTKEANPRA